tara:strand:+ start:4181 stop:4915 length:735 start_codon:yes stop_codon:yes gene_type:complete
MEYLKLFVTADIFNALEKKHYDPILRLMYSLNKIHVSPETYIQSRSKTAKEERIALLETEYISTEELERTNKCRELMATFVIRNWLRKGNQLRTRFNTAKYLYSEVKSYVELAKTVISILGVDPTRGHKESMYQKCLVHEIRSKYGSTRGSVCTERVIQNWYPPKPYGMTDIEAMAKNYLMLGSHNRLDIEHNSWILELKSIENLTIHCTDQLRNYIIQTEYSRGILINFNQRTRCIDWKVIFA